MKNFELTKMQGIHIHFGDCNTPKEGSSGSLASTLAIYSLFTQKRIRNNIAVTGEINLLGEVKTVGGLNSKILGGIKAGVTAFFYPFVNQKDIDHFLEKNGKEIENKKIVLIPVRSINEFIHYNEQISIWV
jgi:ATP-dependent Lon protease